jgi:aminopeptidase N
MFAPIARFEFRYQLRNPVFWVAAVSFFLLSFGAIAGGESVQLGAGGNVHANSPYAIVFTQSVFLILYMFAATAFVANVVVRDDETKFGPILRSTRITKANYLLGRFTGAFAASALAFLSVPMGFWLGSVMPWLDTETLGPGRLDAYAYAYFFIALPSIFLMSAIFFALATATRSMMGTYLGVVGFVVLYILSNRAFGGRADLERVQALIEPFGFRAFDFATRYWTAADRNTLLAPLEDVLLYNRLIWIAVALACIALSYTLYRFAERGISKRQQRRHARLDRLDLVPRPFTSAPLPSPHWGTAAARAQLLSRIRLEMQQIFRSPAFLVLLIMGLLMSVTSLWGQTGQYGTPAIPVTRTMIQGLRIFSLFPFIIAVYYAGELVWRERDRRVHEIVDATPIPGWSYVVPKTIALSLVLLSTLVISVLAAILVQLGNGFTDIELSKYLFWYLLPVGADAILLAGFATFVQAASPSKYVGWGIMLLYFVMQATFSGLGIEHSLFLFGEVPATPTSDMNGLGDFWIGPWWTRFYWTAVAFILLVAAHLLWQRGTETRFRPRLRGAVTRLKGAPGVLAGVALAAALLTGTWIVYNTTVLNAYQTSDERERLTATYEKRFLRYEALPHPSVSQVKLTVALYPEDKRAEASGRYVLTNLTNRPISNVHVRLLEPGTQFTDIAFPGATLASDDAEFRYRIYRLDSPMAPGQSRVLSFRTVRDQDGFRDGGDDTGIVENGTFLNNVTLLPVVGMSRLSLLEDRTKRRKYGLPAELRPAKLEDQFATSLPEFGISWTTSDITLSTVAGQTPLAPGRKVSDVTASGRRTARFVSTAPIANFFSIQSARYAEKHLNHGGVDLGVYYHPEHAWNVDRMLRAMTTSLDYYRNNFGPYPFDHARITEFPDYGTPFAQAFAATMPFSEGQGFLADMSDPDRLDYVTFTIAHELAHQYWGHQIQGAAMQGSTMLSETLSEYSALMVMRGIYGQDKMRRFLKYKLDAYLRGRSGEAVEELPLVRVEDQQYVHYHKGSVVMYLLADRLGEDAVNRALSRLLTRYKFKGAPYPRSADLVTELRREARNAADQSLITDLLERITVYDFKVDAPTATQRPDGRWDVAVTVIASKFFSDGRGNDRESMLEDNVAVGLFTAEPGLERFDAENVLIMQRRPIRSGRQLLRFVSARKPTHAGIDPYNLYIDRNSGDNIRPVS